MSRITYVSQYFVSADQPGGVRHWQHTRALAARGHDVTVITSYVQHKERTIAPRYRGRKIVTEQEGDLRDHADLLHPGLRRRSALTGRQLRQLRVLGRQSPPPAGRAPT